MSGISRARSAFASKNFLHAGSFPFDAWGKRKSEGTQHRMKVGLTIKRLLDCPMTAKTFYAKLKWGRSVWGVKEEMTEAVLCSDRTVVWNQSFQYECQVYMEPGANLEDASERERLLKKQPASAFLRISLRQDSDKSFGKHNRYGFVEVNLVEWAWEKGDGNAHQFGMLVYGTNNTSHLEVEVEITWMRDSANASTDKIDTNLTVKEDGGAEHTMSPILGHLAQGESGAGLQVETQDDDEWSNTDNDAEVKLNDEQLQFLSSGALKHALGPDRGEDRVLVAIHESRVMNEGDSKALIEDIFQRFSRDKEQDEEAAAAQAGRGGFRAHRGSGKNLRLAI